jgi:predicted alpha/beta superfamily hydrolase
LDGAANFSAFTGIVNHLSEILGNRVVPRMIVVGILNTDRSRDLTPTIATVNENGKTSRRSGRTGGGEKFVSFMKNELIPYIDSSYRTSAGRILIGHSLGGLTVMNVLVNHTDLFNAYVAIDPSMWWDNRKLLLQAGETLKQKKFEGRSLFLAIANTMKPGMDTTQMQTDTSEYTNHIRSIFLLRNVLQQNPGNGLNWSYKYYHSDSHGSVPLIAEYDAMRFIFKSYKPTDDDK